MSADSTTTTTPALEEVSHYAHGRFSWADYAAHDVEAAKQFYGALFGWTFFDIPMGEGMFYSMGNVNGKPVVGLAPMQDHMRAAGAPPYWSLNVAVDSADEVQARIAAAGGTPLGEPTDIFDQGRMTVAQDPTGGVLFLWEARAMAGSAYAGGPGVPTWRDLYTTDVTAAADFYKSLLGWEIEMMEGPGGPVAMCVVEGKQEAMIIETTPEMGPIPTAWIVYFGVPDVYAAVEQVNALGGTVTEGPLVIAGWLFAHCTDPQRGVFSIVSQTQPQ